MIKAINVNKRIKNIKPKIALNTHQVTRTNRSKNIPKKAINKKRPKIPIRRPPNLVKKAIKYI